MSKGPFKMKGSPMKRNFGIGASPIKSHKPGHEAKRQHFDPTAGDQGRTKDIHPDKTGVVKGSGIQYRSPIKAKGWLLKKLGFKKTVKTYLDKELKKNVGKNVTTSLTTKGTGSVSTRIIKDSSKHTAKSPSNLASKLKDAGKKKTVQKISAWVKKNPKKAAGIFGAGAFGIDKGIQKIKEGARARKAAKDEMNKPKTPPKSTGRKTYKQAYADPKVTAKYKDKGGYKQFVKEADDWWKTSAGQSYAKKNPQFKHRINK